MVIEIGLIDPTLGGGSKPVLGGITLIHADIMGVEDTGQATTVNGLQSGNGPLHATALWTKTNIMVSTHTRPSTSLTWLWDLWP